MMIALGTVRVFRLSWKKQYIWFENDEKIELNLNAISENGESGIYSFTVDNKTRLLIKVWHDGCLDETLPFFSNHEK